MRRRRGKWDKVKDCFVNDMLVMNTRNPERLGRIDNELYY